MPEENVNVRIQKSIELNGSINEEYLLRQKLIAFSNSVRVINNIVFYFLANIVLRQFFCPQWH